MGKDLHYSIRPFIEKALKNHSSVNDVLLIENDEFYAYLVTRKHNFSDVIVVLSDDYHFGSASYAMKPALLKNGGFYLIARPEASDYAINYEYDKLSIGKIGKLLGALNHNDFWKYSPPIKTDNTK